MLYIFFIISVILLMLTENSYNFEDDDDDDDVFMVQYIFLNVKRYQNKSSYYGDFITIYRIEKTMRCHCW